MPKGVIDIYWLGAYPKVKLITENWTQYVEHSCSEFMDSFNALMINVNFEKEVLELESLMEEKESGVNIEDYLYFELDIKSETNYFEFISKYIQ